MKEIGRKTKNGVEAILYEDENGEIIYGFCTEAEEKVFFGEEEASDNMRKIERRNNEKNFIHCHQWKTPFKQENLVTESPVDIFSCLNPECPNYKLLQ